MGDNGSDALHHSLGLIFLGFGMALLVMSLSGVEQISSGTVQLVFLLALTLMGVGVGGRMTPTNNTGTNTDTDSDSEYNRRNR